MQITQTDLHHESVVCAEAKFSHAGYLKQEVLLEALKQVGIPNNKLPAIPSDHVTLGRAVAAIAGRKDRVETTGDGWSLTVVDPEKLDLEKDGNTGTDAHTVCLTAKVLLAGDVRQLRITPEDHPCAALIRFEWDKQQNLFKCSDDISKWLSKVIIPWVGAVASGSRGGSYYVPKGTGLDNMIKVKEVLDSVSARTHKSFQVTGTTQVISLDQVVQGTIVSLKPEFAELDAIRLLLNGIIEETDKLSDELFEKLGQAKDGELQERAVKTQVARAAQMKEKLVSYSTALGIDLADLHSRLDEVSGNLDMFVLERLNI